LSTQVKPPLQSLSAQSTSPSPSSSTLLRQSSVVPDPVLDEAEALAVDDALDDEETLDDPDALDEEALDDPDTLDDAVIPPAPPEPPAPDEPLAAEACVGSN
jgi:hypothetical protein